MILYLRAVSLLLPSALRSDWLREWHAELWHVRSESASPLQREVSSLHFLRGALPDACSLRRQHRSARTPLALNARQILFRFSAGLLAVLAVALLLPKSRRVLLAHPYRSSEEIVFLKDISQPSVAYAEFVDWSHRRHSRFRQLAFYALTEKTVHNKETVVRLTAAYATPNLLYLLGMTAAPTKGPALYLSASAAARLGRPAVVTVGGRQMPVAGLLPRTTLSLPGEPDLILLEDRLPMGIHGRVLAQSAGYNPELRWGLTVLHPGAGAIRLECIPLQTCVFTPLRAFVFALILALLALPATRPLSHRNNPLDRQHLPRHLRLTPSVFLFAQMMLLLAIVFFSSLTLSLLLPTAQPSNNSLLQAVIAFTLLLPGLRLTLSTHRHRCPCCLRRLAHPARVGQPSAAFLNWYGTELFCTEGHGLLHVPELPTTWFPAPRWMPLDASWSTLFS